jgi:hypothetical protein
MTRMRFLITAYCHGVVSHKVSQALRSFSDLYAFPMSYDHPPELSGSNQQRDLVAKEGDCRRENGREFCRGSRISLSCSAGFFNMPYNRTTWNRRQNLPSEDVVLRICVALKIYRPRPGLNTGTLGPVASKITTRPPRPTA